MPHIYPHTLGTLKMLGSAPFLLYKVFAFDTLHAFSLVQACLILIMHWGALQRAIITRGNFVMRNSCSWPMIGFVGLPAESGSQCIRYGSMSKRCSISCLIASDQLSWLSWQLFCWLSHQIQRRKTICSSRWLYKLLIFLLYAGHWIIHLPNSHVTHVWWSK